MLCPGCLEVGHEQCPAPQDVFFNTLFGAAALQNTMQQVATVLTAADHTGNLQTTHCNWLAAVGCQSTLSPTISAKRYGIIIVSIRLIKSVETAADQTDIEAQFVAGGKFQCQRTIK